MVFQDKEYFLLLILLIPYILWYFLFRHRAEPTMRVGSIAAYEKVSRGWRTWLVHLPMLLRCVAFALIVTILARPQTSDAWDESEVEGIDIMLVMDVSSSMLAEDLKPNRIEEAKKVAEQFIAGRPNDNIGLTIFAEGAFTQCPMTTDHVALLNLLREVKLNVMNQDEFNNYTAIGTGLGVAVSRLDKSTAKSKVVILLTDGVNNHGEESPKMAAMLAQDSKVRVYTIGVGARKSAPYPVLVGGSIQKLNVPTEIDEEVLKEIASMTNGKFYRATNNHELQNIYSEIDKLEKSKVQVKNFSKKYEAFMPFAWALLITLLLEVLLRNTLLRRIP